MTYKIELIAEYVAHNSEGEIFSFIKSKDPPSHRYFIIQRC